MICEDCVPLHYSFGDQVSYIRSVVTDEWNNAMFLYMRFGGNANYKAYLASYNIDMELPAVRYNTKAAEYYRMRVRSSLSFFDSYIRFPKQSL